MVFNRSLFCQVARHPSPETLPPNIYCSHTDTSITIFDAYPKAEYHFLVIPRVSKNTQDKLRTPKNLMSLKALFAAPGIEKREMRDFFQQLKNDAEALREELEEDMRMRRGVVWKINVGFHAIQSMDHIHLHIVSEDFCSPALKHKKHYNSFHPELGFFLHLDDVLAWFSEDVDESFTRSMTRLDEVTYERKLKGSLQCFHCGDELKNIPSLKGHLQQHFEALIRKAEPKK